MVNVSLYGRGRTRKLGFGNWAPDSETGTQIRKLWIRKLGQDSETGIWPGSGNQAGFGNWHKIQKLGRWLRIRKLEPDSETGSKLGNHKAPAGETKAFIIWAVTVSIKPPGESWACQGFHNLARLGWLGWLGWLRCLGWRSLLG